MDQTMSATEALERLNTDGFVVIERLLDERDRRRSPWACRAHPRPRACPPHRSGRLDHHRRPGGDVDFEYWRSGKDEIERMKRRIRHRQADEFDTPWPVRANEVCISFIHIPSMFDDGRSQRIFNLINKDTAFAPLVEHPLVLEMMDAELGRDSIVLDMSVNHVGPHTNSAGWHVDSPLTQIAEPLPNFTLSIQSAWMLDDFTVENGATHVVRGSHLTQRKPPSGRAELDNETVLTGPAGSIALWLSQTWHRHGANVTDGVRNGVIIQYGRSWVKPFVDLRTPMTAEQAAAFSPRLRYMLGCNASAPVRG